MLPLKSVANQYLTDSCGSDISSVNKQKALEILYEQIDNNLASEVAYKRMDALIGNHTAAQKIEAILKIGDNPILSSMATTHRLMQIDHRKCRNWTKYEDQRLLCAIHKFGIDNWKTIAQFVGNNRTKSQCSQRWDRGLNPNIKKGPWTSEQDKKLIELVGLYGKKSWKRIAAQFGNRSDVQCRYHYQKLIGDNNINTFQSSENESNTSQSSYIRQVDPKKTDTSIINANHERNMNIEASQSLIKELYEEQYASVFDSDDEEE